MELFLGHEVVEEVEELFQNLFKLDDEEKSCQMMQSQYLPRKNKREANIIMSSVIILLIHMLLLLTASNSFAGGLWECLSFIF